MHWKNLQISSTEIFCMSQKSDISPWNLHECTAFHILRYDKLVLRKSIQIDDTHDRDREYKKELKNTRPAEGE